MVEGSLQNDENESFPSNQHFFKWVLSQDARQFYLLERENSKHFNSCDQGIFTLSPALQDPSHYVIEKIECFDKNWDSLDPSQETATETLKLRIKQNQTEQDFKKIETQFKLTQAERAAIKAYTHNEFHLINRYLRCQKNFVPDYCNFVSKLPATEIRKIKIQMSSLTQALKKLPVFKGYVYRVIFEAPAPVVEKLKSGVFTDAGFISTTLVKNVLFDYFIEPAKKFLSPHNLILKILSKNGRQIDGLSYYSEEREVLFFPNAQFKVISIEQRSDFREAVLQEM